MSVPDSRKSFLAKLSLCGLAALTAPALFWRRATATRGVDGGEERNAPGSASIALKPDPRAVAREAADV